MKKYYTIRQAAETLAANVQGIGPDGWRIRITGAIMDGHLIGASEGYAFDIKHPGAGIGVWRCEVRADDLNAWLDFRRVQFRFDEDDAPTTVAENAPAETVPPETAPAQNTPIPAPVVKDKAKRKTWRDVALCYVVATYKDGQFATAKAFFKGLEGKAGIGDSPFTKGTGGNNGSLFVTAIGKPLSLKTIENAWAEIRRCSQTG